MISTNNDSKIKFLIDRSVSRFAIHEWMKAFWASVIMTWFHTLLRSRESGRNVRKLFGPRTCLDSLHFLKSISKNFTICMVQRDISIESAYKHIQKKDQLKIGQTWIRLIFVIESMLKLVESEWASERRQFCQHSMFQCWLKTSCAHHGNMPPFDETNLTTHTHCVQSNLNYGK